MSNRETLADNDLGEVAAAIRDAGEAAAILRRTAELLPGQAVFASSLGLEDQVIFDLIVRLELDIPIFTLDTGRLFRETYDLIAATEKKYGRRIKVFFPRTEDVEAMTAQHGVNLFFDGAELRRECCRVRKLEPLKRALAPYRAWICGLRREQAVTRNAADAAEIDGRGRLKINPLVAWSETDLREYVRRHEVPYNPLHDQGFPSIGCACCTRAVAPGEHLRTGRWWWEAPERKECGLHWVDGKLVRSKQQ